jgi:Leucine-rich repeat (LRR) protein
VRGPHVAPQRKPALTDPQPLRTDVGCLLSWASLGLRELHGSWLPSFLLGADVVGLDLSDNHLTALNTTVLSLFPYLLGLDLSNNALTTLPTDEEWCAGGFSVLNELYVESNQLTVLPAYLFQLTTLRTLSASHNMLQLLPLDDKWLDSALVHVDLSHNRLRSVPESLFRVPTLKYLSLAHNALIELPAADHWNLPSLTDLNLGSNPLPDLPALSGLQTPRLVSLCLSRTPAHGLPSSLASLPALKALDLSYCMNIIHIPPAIFSVRTLVSLNVRGLTLPDIPKKLTAGNVPSELLGFLRSRDVASGTFDLVNVVIMGGPATGKSLLDTSLFGKKANGALRLWQHRPARGLLGPRLATLTFRTWDLGGSYVATAVRCALRKQTLFLVTWSLIDGQSGIDALGPLLLDIYALSPCSAVIIVATHCDQHAAVMRARGKSAADIKEAVDAYRATLRHKFVRPGYPRISAMTEVGLQTGVNINLLKDLIYAAAVDVGGAYGRSGLDHPIPQAAAILIRFLRNLAEESLSGLRAPLITVAELRRLRASANALIDVPAADLTSILRLLEMHDIIARLPGLSQEDDCICLDLQWLIAASTDAMRSALRGTCNGLLQLSAIPPILGGVQCPANFHPYLLNYLERNKLCIRVDSITWLAPHALPDAQITIPAFLALSAAQRVFRRRYVLPCIPIDLWPVLLTELLPCVTSYAIISHLSPDHRVSVPYCSSETVHALSRELIESPSLTLWSRGIAFGPSPSAGFVVQQLPLSEGILGIDVCVVSPPAASDPDPVAAVMLGHVSSHIERALGRAYPGWSPSHQHVDPSVAGIFSTPATAALPTAAEGTGAGAGVLTAAPPTTNNNTAAPGRRRSTTAGEADRSSSVSRAHLLEGTGGWALDGSQRASPAHELQLVGRCELQCICMRRPEAVHFISMERCLEASTTCQSVACPLPVTEATLPARVRLDFLAPDVVLCCDAVLQGTDLVSCGEDRIDSLQFGRMADGVRVQLIARRCVRTARLDFAILSQIHFPALHAPLGLHLSPPSLVYTLPPVGTLRELLPKIQAAGLSMPLSLCCRMARQMCEALAFMHSLNFVHGALSLATVGVWSLCAHAAVNIKLLAAPVPLPHRPSATAAGFVAPEILHGNFVRRGSDKADVFAAGMVLWSMLILAPPLAGLGLPCEIHAAIACGRRPNCDDLLAAGACEPLVELLKDMWHARPSIRPTASIAAARLASPLFRYLQHTVRTTKDNRLECAVAVKSTAWLCSGDQHSSQVCASVIVGMCGGGGWVWMWVSSPDQSASTSFFRLNTHCWQITCLSFDRSKTEPVVTAGFGVAHSRILSACAVGQQVWVGTQAGDIFEFSSLQASSHYTRRTHLRGKKSFVSLLE